MGAESSGELDSLLAGVSKLMAEDPKLAKLAENLDLSPLLSLLGSSSAPEGAAEAPADAAEPQPVPAEALSMPSVQRADRTAALLAALRPFLNPERAALVDRALRMLSVAKNVRVALRTVGTLSVPHTP